MSIGGLKSYGNEMYRRVSEFIGSNWFFSLILTIFAMEAIWLAIVNRYGMAFDEGYHFGLIQFFSNHLSPIITTQSTNTYNLGAIAHNSSFLYHFLFSFPYRLITHFTDNLKTTVILLRFINISLAIANLIIIKRLLKEINLPKIPANLIIFAFAFTPMVCVLAAQINYDNLLLPLISLTVLLTVVFVKALNKNQLNLRLLLAILAVCLFASLVKFEFLPVFIGVILILAFELYEYGQRKSFGSSIKKAYQQISGQTKIILGTALVAGLCLFTVSYGVNLVKYHNPVPSCDQILNIKACKQYYAWDRNYTLATHKLPNAPTMNIIHYLRLWGSVMYYQIFAEIVPTGGLVYIQPMFKIIVFALTGLAGLCVLLSWKKLASNKPLILLAIISLVYLLVLLSRNYHDYLQLGEPVAIQGRYLLPVLPFIYAFLGMGIYFVTQRQRLVKELDKQLVVILVIFSFLYWGGFVRYAQIITPKSHWPTRLHRTNR